MATLVPMKPELGTLFGRLTISGIVQWHFHYTSRFTEKPLHGTSNKPQEPFVIGDPAGLNGTFDAWSINATNQTAGDTEYWATLEWIQGEDVIASWRDPKSGTKTVKSAGTVRSDGLASLVIE